jgi:hypothetical protein
MALVGIGDTLFGSGRYEEAVRRYRIALGEAPIGEDRAVIEVKMALCEHALGREDEARGRMNSALSRIPLLSGWMGREEEFYHSMSMIGVGVPETDGEKIFLLVGPLNDTIHLDKVTGRDIPSRKIRREGRLFLEMGPIGDAVEAMILSGKIKDNTSLPVEILTR